jgi:DNA-binding NarL/FixJ family response regulator
MYLLPIQSDVFEYVQAGVSGFILKDANTAQFVKTIRTVYQGAKVLPLDLTGPLFSQVFEHSSEIDTSVRMTKREREVVELIAEGLTNKEIAKRLHLSPYTIKSHVHNILEKLTLSTRVQIAKHTHLSESNKNTLDNTSLFKA